MKKILLGVVAVLILIQLVPVDRDNPESDPANEISANADVKQILNKACYDCHSNQTKWPAYSYIAPVSWVITNHVKDGRKHLNFSEWASYSEKRKNKKLEEIVEETAEGEMPLTSYVLGHPAAKLSSHEFDQLKQWANSMKTASQQPAIGENESEQEERHE
ncbi:MAG: heme-binding domain-containing protein [Calditrichaeota bacterium]|nr:heme-binding domain-containing protein [Calditrichota bacterium]